MNGISKENLDKLKERLHHAVVKRDAQAGRIKEDIYTENLIFRLLCEDPGVPPTKLAIRVNDRYGYDLTGDDVINVFRANRMAFPKERIELFQWAEKIAEQFEKAATGDTDSFKAFEKARKGRPESFEKYHKSQERICALMIYSKFPELATLDDDEIIDKFGNTLSKYFFFDMSDAICEVYGFPKYKESKPGASKISEPFKSITLDEAMKRIESLEAELEMTSNMLAELQNEFSDQLAESKVKELTDFFAKLNSEKYGCILDQLLDLRKGVDELRKNGFEVPVEISGVLIVIKKLIQFVKDSHIDPILKPGSLKIVKASDVEFFDYIGSPFTSEDEEKTIKTLSPGWIFKDKEIQISRPRVQEVTE